MPSVHPIDELRRLVMNADACSETFNQSYTIDQLVQIHRMLAACEWDILPDRWTERQLDEALRGIVPQWDDAERPIYTYSP